MPKTISFHNGASWSRGHNTRDERYTKDQEHIDPSLTANNAVLVDIPVREAYEQIFGQSVEEYNAKQGRADRRIDDYYNKIKQDKRKHPVYECIVQIGDRNDTGNSAILERQALERFVREWNERNPNLKLIGAYIHADEPDGTVHLHCDYIPVAECRRGMRLQNSLDKALTQQGFKSENIHNTAQIAWQDSERESLCAICRELNIDAQHSQGISEDRGHLSKREYIRAKEDLNEELKPLKQEIDEYKYLQTAVKSVEIERKKIPFSKRVSVDVGQLDQLEEQARAYNGSKTTVEKINKKIKETDASFKRTASYLKDKLNTLSQRERELDAREQRVRQAEGVLDKLDSAERELRTVKAENAQLRRTVKQLEHELHPPKRSRGMER